MDRYKLWYSGQLVCIVNDGCLSGGSSNPIKCVLYNPHCLVQVGFRNRFERDFYKQNCWFYKLTTCNINDCKLNIFPHSKFVFLFFIPTLDPLLPPYLRFDSLRPICEQLSDLFFNIFLYLHIHFHYFSF